MSYPYSLIKTAATGDILAASDYNNEHTNHITNNTPASIDDASSNTAAMQATTTPGGVGTESLATDLLGEIKRLRYAVNRIIGRSTQWYDAPETDLHTLYGLNPTGMIHPFAGAKASVPTGYLYCDGSAVSRSSYSGLFTVIGTKWGTGDGSTTFNVPDLRGRFLRGQDDGTARDPDASSRTANASGGNTGDNVGTVQGEAYKSHTHTRDVHGHTLNDPTHTHGFTGYSASGAQNVAFTNTANSAASSTNLASVVANTTGITANSTTATNQNSGGNETRPINVAVVWVIKT